ncbi:MAG: hypothetical protein LBF63_02920 [Treponema sp.]|jgi:hypothetical protein|nr:hypothetical protein [Treponema sp.]
MVVSAGDVKLDNRKYKDRFGLKARMLSPEEARRITGHAVGGVCPFGLQPPSGQPRRYLKTPGLIPPRDGVAEFRRGYGAHLRPL